MPFVFKATCSLLALFSTATARRTTKLPSFESFVALQRRSYEVGSAEYAERRTHYEKNVAAAATQNSGLDAMWTAAPNDLWDWSDTELKTLRNWEGGATPKSATARAASRAHLTFLQREPDTSTPLPEEKMWSDLAMAKRIKNQGPCGSCWAVASASVLEGHVEIHSGVERTFSIEQIVRCTPNPMKCGGEGGCRGATAELAMEWVLQNGCSDATAEPYTGTDGACSVNNPEHAMMNMLTLNAEPSAATAQASTGGAAFGMTGWETLPKNEYEPLVRALAELGPVAVSVAASPWHLYGTGIFNGCGKDAVIDHAVTAIGYGAENGQKYWLIQNSWGQGWGELGHIRLERHDGSEGYCGMNNDPEKGVACKGDTTPVPVCGMCGVLFDSVVPHFGA